MDRRSSAKSAPTPPTRPAEAAAPPDAPGRAPRRLLLLAVAGLALAGAALAVRMRAGDRDAELRGLNTEQLAALAHLQPNDAAVHYHLAARLAGENRLAAARAEYDAAVRLVPGSARAQLGLGRTLAALGSQSEAEAALTEAVRLDGRSAEAEYALGKTMWSEGKAKEALAHLRRATELDPRNADAWYGRAVCLSGSNQDPEALDCLGRALALKDNSAPYHAALAEILVRHGQMSEALKHYGRAVQLDPSDGEACAQLGQFLVTNPPDASSDRRAEELLLKAAKLPTSHPAEVWFDLGQLYARTNRPRQAADALARSVKLDPRDERFYYALATAYRKLGDEKSAAAAEARFKRISALHSRMDHLSALVAARPDDAADRMELARVCQEIGLPQQAAAHYSIVARSGPPVLQADARRALAALAHTGGIPPPAALP